MIKIDIVDQNGNSLEQSVANRLHNILSRLNNTGPLIQHSLVWTVRNHFQTIYPGSQHYSPDKVVGTSSHNGDKPYGEVEIDVPGITRAYHDMHIKPKFRKYLSIPIHQSSYGKSPKQFDNLIFIQKKNGSKLLAQKLGTGLVFLYALKNQVFQRKDSRLMPSDETLATNVCSRIKSYLSLVK